MPPLILCPNDFDASLIRSRRRPDTGRTTRQRRILEPAKVLARPPPRVQPPPRLMAPPKHRRPPDDQHRHHQPGPGPDHPTGRRDARRRRPGRLPLPHRTGPQFRPGKNLRIPGVPLPGAAPTTRHPAGHRVHPARGRIAELPPRTHRTGLDAGLPPPRQPLGRPGRRIRRRTRSTRRGTAPAGRHPHHRPHRTGPLMTPGAGRCFRAGGDRRQRVVRRDQRTGRIGHRPPDRARPDRVGRSGAPGNTLYSSWRRACTTKPWIRRCSYARTGATVVTARSASVPGAPLPTSYGTDLYEKIFAQIPDDAPQMFTGTALPDRSTSPGRFHDTHPRPAAHFVPTPGRQCPGCHHVLMLSGQPPDLVSRIGRSGCDAGARARAHEHPQPGSGVPDRSLARGRRCEADHGMTDSRHADNLPPLISASAESGIAPSGAPASADAWSPTTAVPDGAPVFPLYDTAWLGAVLPGAAQALGVTVKVPALTLPTARSVCVVIVDGLGRMLLEETADRAPFLTSLLPGSITLTAGCPSTTATSMGSFGTGLPPGRHGLVGYEVMDPARGVLLNELKWDPGTDPLAWQPHPTMFEELADHGVAVTRIGNPGFDGSGLTLAALRGGAFVGEKRVDTRVDVAVAALSRPDRGLVYLYWGALDGAGHQHGWRSPQWRRQLRHVDRELARLARRLAPGTVLLVTGDHGMVDVPQLSAPL